MELDTFPAEIKLALNDADGKCFKLPNTGDTVFKIDLYIPDYQSPRYGRVVQVLKGTVSVRRAGNIEVLGIEYVILVTGVDMEFTQSVKRDDVAALMLRITGEWEQFDLMSRTSPPTEKIWIHQSAMLAKRSLAKSTRIEF